MNIRSKESSSDNVGMWMDRGERRAHPPRLRLPVRRVQDLTSDHRRLRCRTRRAHDGEFVSAVFLACPVFCRVEANKSYEAQMFVRYLRESYSCHARRG